MDIGNIVYFGSEVFNDIDGNNILSFTKSIDHVYGKGIGCIHIGDIDETMYFIPIFFAHNNSKSQILIEPTRTNKLISTGVVAADVILKKNFCFMESIGYIPAVKLYEIYKDILNFYRNFECDDDKKEDINTIIGMINNYIKEFEYNKKKGFYRKPR